MGCINHRDGRAFSKENKIVASDLYAGWYEMGDWLVNGRASSSSASQNRVLSSIAAFRRPEEKSIAFYSLRHYNIFITVTVESTPEYQLESREWAVPHSPSS
jgi:hypothetical protein